MDCVSETMLLWWSLYDPKEFDDEYSAYKHGTIYELLKKISRREHKMSGATAVIADKPFLS